MREEKALARRASASEKSRQRNAAKRARTELALLADTVKAELGPDATAEEVADITLRVMARKVAKSQAAKEGLRGDGSLFFSDDEELNF